MLLIYGTLAIILQMCVEATNEEPFDIMTKIFFLCRKLCVQNLTEEFPVDF